MSIMKKVYPDRLFLRARKGRLFWKKEGEEVIKNNLEKQLEERKKVLQERKNNDLDNVAILFFIEVPIEYTELVEEGSYIEKRINEFFSDFETKVGGRKEMKERLEKEIKEENIAEGVVNMASSWLEQDYIHSREFKDPIPRIGNFFLGIIKK